MTAIFEHSLWEALEITGLVFIMLVLMDLLYMFTRGRVGAFLVNHPRTQYVISAFLGAIPGCEGAFLAVSLYAHGMISVGALFATFIATTGDEAVVMLSLFPRTALGLFAGLWALGSVLGWAFDLVYKRLNTGGEIYCTTPMFHPHDRLSWSHYFGKHLWSHLIKEHLIKIFIWTWVAVFLIEWLEPSLNLEQLVRENPYSALFTAGLFGLIPHSGPHLIFVNLFARGSIPFSILLTNAIVQNGHALLPLLSISIRISLLLKVTALAVGLLIGLLAYSYGF